MRTPTAHTYGPLTGQLFYGSGVLDTLYKIIAVSALAACNVCTGRTWPLCYLFYTEGKILYTLGLLV